MFYRPEIDPHGLPHDPFKACIVPRPIAWVSTRSPAGVRNLAPFSFFNAFSWAPPMVALGMPGRNAEGRAKDTFCNIEDTGEFVVNLASWAQREAVNLSSAQFAPEEDEFEQVSVASAASRLVGPDRVAEAPVSLECRHYTNVPLPARKAGRSNMIVVGEVIGIHIRDDVLTDGRIDLRLMQPVCRLGYRDWAGLGEVVEQLPPERVRI
ncbi:flavin reductase [Primorskyibacter flagellatus]|uniref:Flavin reductase n=1 Tax=Primorskyibacter flagellatus TaxID=1387277 RepID=A0A917AF20_9RHOB|nr:flavin reductase family protein [Primorskyibacter flagellatus]GGE46152.1 flavin reductase [Primorskyibacter flagellatus]